MTDDFIDSMFADLDDFYPGSKRKRKEAPKKEEVTSIAWDLNPTKRTLPNGKDVEMFTIGALANALNRPIITLRKWIKEGHLPSSPYRLPTTKNRYGGDHQGKRLYSRAMVEAAIELFAHAGVLTTKRIDWSKHKGLSNDLLSTWNKIRENETTI